MPEAQIDRRPSLFCISSYEKGQAFLREAAASGCEVRLLTVDKLRDADWPKDVLTEFMTMPEEMTPEQVRNTVCYLARTRHIDRLVPLDEFDLEAAALLREHMEIPGLGQTATRFFRDKLAMRSGARAAGIPVPDFCPVVNYEDVRAFFRDTEGPWLLKPRTNASAIGIRKVQQPDDLWPMLDTLGDLQSDHLLECFAPGEVFHVEGITWKGKLLFSQAFAYGKPPLETMHQGGVFTTRTLAADSADALALYEIHSRLMAAFPLDCGVTHSEFIRSRGDGRFLFLETAARVGGAYIAETLEFATNINPWVEWARIESALAAGTEYKLPEVRRDFAGSVISLARQAEPDLASYTDPEIAMRLHKPHHAGIVLRSTDEARLRNLVESYARRFLDDFCAVLPAPDKATT